VKPGLVDHLTGECRPCWRGKIHAVSASVALPAGVALTYLSSYRVVTGIYAFALFVTLATSAIYHCLSRSPQQQLVLRRLDHAMIFVLIAGTWTPLCLVSMSPRAAAALLCLTWLVAALGITLALSWRATKLKDSLYFVGGAIAATAILFAPLSLPVLALLAAGCVAFAGGGVLFLMQRPKAWPLTFGFHECWHALTIVGAATHFAAVSIAVTA
jgi:hemolysin III